jgi:hypothetical protein
LIPLAFKFPKDEPLSIQPIQEDLNKNLVTKEKGLGLSIIEEKELLPFIVKKKKF